MDRIGAAISNSRWEYRRNKNMQQAYGGTQMGIISLPVAWAKKFLKAGKVWMGRL